MPIKILYLKKIVTIERIFLNIEKNISNNFIEYDFEEIYCENNKKKATYGYSMPLEKKYCHLLDRNFNKFELFVDDRFVNSKMLFRKIILKYQDYDDKYLNKEKKIIINCTKCGILFIDGFFNNNKYLPLCLAKIIFKYIY